MTFRCLRPDGERRLFELSPIEAISPQSICLPPHINQRAILRAVPIHQAGQVRTGGLEMLYCLIVTQVAHVMGIYNVKHALLSSIHDQARSGNQNGAGSIEICIDGVQMRMIRGRKPIQHFEVGVELEKAFAEIRTAIPASVAGDKVDVSLRIDSRSLAKLPDACRLPFRRSIEHSGLLKRPGVIADQEAVIRLFVTMRRVANVSPSAGEKQA